MPFSLDSEEALARDLRFELRISIASCCRHQSVTLITPLRVGLNAGRTYLTISDRISKSFIRLNRRSRAVDEALDSCGLLVCRHNTFMSAPYVCA
jgi:hypothetical protein